MTNLLKISSKSLLACALVAIAPIATAAGLDEVKPYVGLDAQWRQMHTRHNYDSDAASFKKTAPQANLYLGVKFHEYVGLEVGYEATSQAKKEFTLGADETLLGLPGLPTGAYKSKASIRGWHADLVGFAPINEDCRLQAIGSVGGAWLRSKRSIFQVATSTTEVDNSQKKTVLRLGLGLQQMLNDQLGWRAGINWENLAKFKDKSGNSIYKNSVTPSVGVVVHF